MKYLDKQIEKIVKVKQKAQADLIDSQANFAKKINAHGSQEPKFALSKNECEMYMRDMYEYFDKIKHCEVVIAELIVLKQMNEG